MKFKYCPECGNELTKVDVGDELGLPFCSICKVPYFDHVNVCIISAVINEFDEIALLKQNYVSDKWVLVAGHISFGETLEDCCNREVNEETGQIATSIKYIDSYVYPKKELLMVGFDSRVKKKAFNNSSEVDELEWFDLRESPKHLREGSIARQLVEEIINREKTDERD